MSNRKEAIEMTRPVTYSDSQFHDWLVTRNHVGQGQQWNNYRDLWAMPDYEGSIDQEGSITRSRAIVGAARMDILIRIRMEYVRYQFMYEKWSLLIEPDGGWTVELNDGLLMIVSRDLVLKHLQFLSLYCIRALALHETVMKVNQVGSGGKGGLLSSYPH